MNADNAINLIALALDGQEWSPDTLDFIADVVRAAGRDIRDSEELE